MNDDKTTHSPELEIEDKNIFLKWLNSLYIAIKRTFTGHTKTTWVWIILFVIISIISGGILVLQYTDRTWLFDKVIRWFVVPIIKSDYVGLLLFIFFMGVQGILVPIPSELVLLCSGLIWDIQLGTIIGIIGSMVAGVITYYIAILGGRPLVERFLGQENLDIIDSYIDKYGVGAIILARAFPFMPFDPISYASGFLKIKFRTYFIATLLGSIIRCVFYAWLGSTLISDREYYINEIINGNTDIIDTLISTNANQFNFMFIILILVLGSAFLFYQFLLMPYLRKKHSDTEKAGISTIKDK